MATDGNTPVASKLTLADFRDRYLATHRASHEERTVEGIELYFKHIAKALGEGVSNQ